MKKVILLLLVASFTMTSCGAKKKIAALEAKNKTTQDLLNSATVQLNTCLTEKKAFADQLDYLKKNNSDLIKYL